MDVSILQARNTNNLNGLVMINKAAYKAASERRDQTSKVVHLQHRPRCWLQLECCECESEKVSG